MIPGRGVCANVGGKAVLAGNPELLREMVHKTGAKSTDLQSPESVDHLCDKCKDYAENWAGKAEEIWDENPHHVESFHNYKSTYQD